jgi:simple sugar transport system ATP-binding protein
MTTNSNNNVQPIMRLTDISKNFSGYRALHKVSIDVFPGEVLCLLGDNGAGKSTVIKVISGFHEPTSGTLEWQGEKIAFKSPRDANELGIATVHQFGGTFPLMSLGRSFFVGLEPTKGWGPFKRIDRKYSNEVVVREMQAM